MKINMKYVNKFYREDKQKMNIWKQCGVVRSNRQLRLRKDEKKRIKKMEGLRLPV